MQIERVGSATTLRIHLHAYEMAALIAAGRWVVDGADGELTPEIREHLARVVASYDSALRKNAAAASTDD